MVPEEQEPHDCGDTVGVLCGIQGPQEGVVTSLK